MGRIRLDMLLTNLGLADSREKARAMVLAGEVTVEGERVDKPGHKVDDTAQIAVNPRRKKFVSRGGFKLEGAIRDFNLEFNTKTVLDVGASTGGYTDCALQHGAKRVVALDVGYGQLDWSLRNDARVRVIERTNIRYFTPEELGDPVDIITIDVSFISTRLLYPVVVRLLKDNGLIVCLIKPQFEAGKDNVGKKGVVKDPQVHRLVLMECIEAAASSGLECVGVTYSPIKGPQGNIEYFLLLRKSEEPVAPIAADINGVVQKAHSDLEG